MLYYWKVVLWTKWSTSIIIQYNTIQYVLFTVTIYYYYILQYNIVQPI